MWRQSAPAPVWRESLGAGSKYLELALAASAGIIVSSDADLLDLDPWRGIRILKPAELLASEGPGS
jgi:predicted nucleic acid-binding protein